MLQRLNAIEIVLSIGFLLTKKYKMAFNDTVEGLLFFTVNNQWKKIKLLQLALRELCRLYFHFSVKKVN